MPINKVSYKKTFETLFVHICFPAVFSPLIICLLSALVVAASLERDLDDLVPHTHVELAAAVQDQQAADGLPLPGGEQLDLLQQAAPRRQVEGRKHFPDGTVICGREKEVAARWRAGENV